MSAVILSCNYFRTVSSLSADDAILIPVLIRDRGIRSHPTKFAQLSNLAAVLHQQTITDEPSPDTINLALLNARSLAGKSFLINDFITDHKLDFHVVVF